MIQAVRSCPCPPTPGTSPGGSPVLSDGSPSATGFKGSSSLPESQEGQGLKKAIIVFVIWHSALSLVQARSSSGLESLQDSFRSVAEKAGPSCVNVSAYHEEEVYDPHRFYFMDPEEFMNEFFYGVPPKSRPRTQKRRYAGMGSGVIIDPKGYVLTNSHVVSDAKEIKVRLEAKGRKKTYSARLIGKDERLDLALVKIEGRGPFPSAVLGDSGAVRVGDWAIAIGSPFGLELEQTFTVGVISALRQSLPIEDRVYRNLIQTDAAINRGNSGGPLLNIKGEVIGINTAIFSPSGVFAGIGFAIPVNAAKEILADMRRGRERQWGWLGVSIGEVDEVVARKFGSASTGGALINEVFEDGPADKAGLKRGDIITHINGQEIAGPNELTELVRKIAVGDSVPVAFIRDGKAGRAAVKIGARPKWADLPGHSRSQAGRQPEPAEKRGLPDETPVPKTNKTSAQWEGIEVLDAARNAKGRVLARKFRAPEGIRGVIIASVDSQSVFSGYLETGDVIAGINRGRTATADEFESAVKAVNLKEGVVFDILRRGNRQFVSVQTP